MMFRLKRLSLLLQSMNIANSLRSHYVFCTAGFAPFPDLAGYVDYKDENATFGVKYSAIPVFLSPLAPSRIDVNIPDQTTWSPDTWSTLGARDSVHMSDLRIRALGITNHLCRALERWSFSILNFEEHYRKLPFGSSIIVSNVEADDNSMQIAFKRNYLL